MPCLGGLALERGSGQCLRGLEGLLLVLLSQFLVLLSQFQLGLVQHRLLCCGRLNACWAFARRDEVLVFERDLLSCGVDERDSALGA